MTASFESLADVAKKVELVDPLWSALLAKLGKPADLDDLACIPKDMLIRELSEFSCTVGEDTVKLTLVQVGRLVKCYDIINGGGVAPHPVAPVAPDKTKA